MGNTRQWTTKFNANNEALEAFVKARAGRSASKRREAMQRAATMPNRLPPISKPPSIDSQEETRS